MCFYCRPMAFPPQNCSLALSSSVQSSKLQSSYTVPREYYDVELFLSSLLKNSYTVLNTRFLTTMVVISFENHHQHSPRPVNTGAIMTQLSSICFWQSCIFILSSSLPDEEKVSIVFPPTMHSPTPRLIDLPFCSSCRSGLYIPNNI